MINAWVSRGRIMASYRSAAGELLIKDIGPAELTAFCRDPDPFKDEWSVTDIRQDHPGWWKLVFADWDSRKFAVENNPLLFEGDVSPVRRFLTDHKCKIDSPKRGYLDIETDSRVPFSEAVLGNTTMLSFAIVGEDGTRETAVLEDWDEKAEAELFAWLWEKMAPFDSMIAWNGERFDFQVINIRSMYFAKKYKKLFENFWANKQRILQVDQLLCFKRHHMAAGSGDEKTSMRLDNVCSSLIGEGKNDFDSSKTYEAWIAGGAARAELVAYNLQDTALLPKLEAKTGYLALQQTIGEVTLCPVNTHTLKPMPWIDAYLLKMAFKRKTHLPSKKRGGSAEDEEVQGAIVMAPTKLGVHCNVHVCDFKSLYPTVIRTWNIGSDTKWKEGDAPNDAVDRDQICRSAFPGVWFRTDEKSMLSEFCEDMMNMRDYWKKRMTEYPPGSVEAEEAERKSKAYKIGNNSGFGVTGNPYFRLYDTDVTSSIIQGARLMLETASAAATAKEKDPIYGDTDSLFVVGGAPDDFDAFVSHCNTVEFPKVLDEHNCRKDFRVVELAYEKQFSRLVFPLGTDGEPSAKRYAGSYAHKGWNKKTSDWNWANTQSKPEIRGLEFMRTDSVARARRMQREAIEMILHKKSTAVELDEWVKRNRELFLEGDVPLEDIVLSKGISKPLDAYKTRGPHVRIAEALAEAGEDVGEGTRISYVVVNGKVSPAEVISATEYKGVCDKRHYWDKAVYPPTMRVLAGAYPKHPWKKWKLGARTSLTQQMFSFF